MKIQKEIIKVNSSKLPSTVKGKKLIVISDLHNSRLGTNNIILKNAIKSLNPDGIIVAGDLFNGVGKNNYSKEFFHHIISNYTVYMVKGNHEENLAYTTPELLEYIISSNIQENFFLLDNSSANFYGINIIGFTSDEAAYKRLFAQKVSVNEIEKKLGIANKSCYNIVVSHNPEGEDSYCKWGADMIVSGHLHGGFIRLFNKGIISPQLKIFPKYTSGRYFINEDCQLIVSRGLGTHFPNPRLFNKPHIILLDFE